MDEPGSSQWLARARQGDEQAFRHLVQPHLQRLHKLAARMLGNPDDAQEVVQESLLRASNGLDGFREDAQFGTWLYSITTRQCLNALRARKRWRWDAQRDLPVAAQEAVHRDPASPAFDPSFVFDAHQHIAFCFTCVGRSLEPEQQVALVLRDVLGLSNAEAATHAGVSQSVLRHRLSDARKHMQRSFDGLCAIVAKQGICYQCSGLRGTFPVEQRGPEVPQLGTEGDGDEERYRHRLNVVSSADLEGGSSARLHELLFRVMGDHETGNSANR
ncbi:MAG: RNA polymerase sigma factor [Nannocystales bacterium]